jgi:hypothetical protein
MPMICSARGFTSANRQSASTEKNPSVMLRSTSATCASPRTRSVSSVTTQNNPSTSLDSPRIGLYDHVKYASSAYPFRYSCSSRRWFHVASPRWKTASTSGPSSAQTSPQTSGADRPSADGCRSPSSGA